MSSEANPVPAVIPDAVVDRAGGDPSRAPAVLPALRSDLAPLIPTMRRAATVIAAAAVADWAMRAGPRMVLRQGSQLVRRREAAAARPGPRRETVIVERVIVQRTF